MNYLETAKNCKMVFNASEYLNGKLEVKITELSANDIRLNIYMWPSKIPKDAMTHGILENGRTFTGKLGDTYEAPTDWTIYI